MIKLASVTCSVLLCFSAGLVGQVIPLSHRDLCQASDHVFVGKVTDLRARMEGTIIVTDATIAPTEQWKGEHAGPTIVTVPGGTLNGVTLRVSETPTFRQGEQVVVFTVLDKEKKQQQVFGCFRGKYTVVRDQIRELKATSLADLRTEIRTILGGR
jgi:hypothetical protein